MQIGVLRADRYDVPAQSFIHVVPVAHHQTQSEQLVVLQHIKD